MSTDSERCGGDSHGLTFFLIAQHNLVKDPGVEGHHSKLSSFLSSFDAAHGGLTAEMWNIIYLSDWTAMADVLHYREWEL